MCCPYFLCKWDWFGVPAHAEMDLIEVCMDLKILCVYMCASAVVVVWLGLMGVQVQGVQL